MDTLLRVYCMCSYYTVINSNTYKVNRLLLLGVPQLWASQPKDLSFAEGSLLFSLLKFKCMYIKLWLHALFMHLIIVKTLSLICLPAQSAVSMSYAFVLGEDPCSSCLCVWAAGFPEILLNRLAILDFIETVSKEPTVLSLSHFLYLLFLPLTRPLYPFSLVISNTTIFSFNTQVCLSFSLLPTSMTVSHTNT